MNKKNLDKPIKTIANELSTQVRRIIEEFKKAECQCQTLNEYIKNHYSK